MPLPKLPFLPEKNSYSYSQASNVVSVQLEGGLSKNRVDIAGAPAILNVEWFLDLAEYQFFRAFVNHQIQSGAGEFKIDLILDQPFIQEFTVKFVVDSIETSEPMGLSLRVSAKLEVVPIDNSEIDEIVLIYYPDYTIFNELEQLVNVDWFIP